MAINLSLLFNRMRWLVVEQLLRWGVYKQEKDGWLICQLRKLALMLGLAL